MAPLSLGDEELGQTGVWCHTNHPFDVEGVVKMIGSTRGRQQ